MNRSVYRNLLRIVGIVLALVGVGAVIGGTFAHSSVTDQLQKEAITMPTQDKVTSLPQESQDALESFFGKEMTTGPAAKAFADDYIWNHIQSSCTSVKTADGTAIEAVPEDQCSFAGVGDVATANKSDDAKYTAYTALRATIFQGESLRGMLLTAYAFWTVGTVALVAGYALIGIGAIMTIVGFAGFRGGNQKSGVQAAE
jgi:hypothetical protein